MKKILLKINKKNKITILIISLGIVLISSFCIIYNLNDKTEKIEKKEFCLIEFESLGGTSIISQKIRCGETLSNLPTPEKEGFEFVEWLYNDTTFSNETEIIDNISLTAKWKVLENYDVVKITFNSKGGTEIADIEIIKGNTLNKPNNPSKNGYVFKGWYLNDKKFNFENKINENITLTAKWEKNKPISEEELKEQINNNDNLTAEEKNDSNSNLSNGNSKKEYYYLYQYDAFETISCKYENFYYKEDTGLCYDNQSINASFNVVCPSGYTETSDGKCSKKITVSASYNKHCKENEIEENGRCYTKHSSSTKAPGICPDGYEFHYGGWGLEKGYCYKSETIEKNYNIVKYTCDGVKSIREPKLVVTENEAYCEGYTLSQSIYIYDYYCSDGYTLSGPSFSEQYTTNEAKCSRIDVKEKEKQYYCPSGYKLSGAKCDPDSNIRYAKYKVSYDCLEGDYGEYTRVMIDNKCYDRYEK